MYCFFGQEGTTVVRLVQMDSTYFCDWGITVDLTIQDEINFHLVYTCFAHANSSWEGIFDRTSVVP